MYVGYIVNDSFPLLKTISLSEINLVKGKLPILIPSQELSLQYSNNDLDFSSKTIEESKVYWGFSKEETTLEKYYEYLQNFTLNCLTRITKNFKSKTIISLNELPLIKNGFIYEDDLCLTITNSNTTYYINKQLYSLYNNLSYDLTNLNNKIEEIYSFSLFTERTNLYQSLLKINNEFNPLSQIKEFLSQYYNFSELKQHIGELYFNFLSFLPNKNKSELQLWDLSYKTEKWLSELKIKVDLDCIEDKLKLFPEDSILTTIYEEGVKGKGYITQNYNGTDKLTGRIYPTGNGYSLQSLGKPLRDIIISEKNCFLVEFDYKHFEYNILSQLCEIPISDDPHLQTAKLILKNETLRSAGKEINYALIYGKELNKFCEELSIKYSLDKLELKESLFTLLSPVLKLKQELEEEFNKTGSLLNFFNKRIYPKSTHACLNNFIQSTASIIFIFKLNKIKDFLEKNTSDKNKILLQSHDSVLINIEKTKLNSIIKEIKEILEAPESKIYNKIDIKYGINWKEFTGINL